MFRAVGLAVVVGGLLCLGSQAGGQESKAAQATRTKLKQKISVDFKEIGTADIFKEIKGEMEQPVNFKIDNASGVSNNTKLTYKAKEKAVEVILNELSDKGEFGWVVISNAANNKVDGWVVIRKSTKGKERGYEAGKEPAKDGKGASLALPREGGLAFLRIELIEPRLSARRD
jgi:hypothetical protein